MVREGIIPITAYSEQMQQILNEFEYFQNERFNSIESQQAEAGFFIKF